MGNNSHVNRMTWAISTFQLPSPGVIRFLQLTQYFLQARSDSKETTAGALRATDTVTKTTPTGTNPCKLTLLQQIPDPLIRFLKSGGKDPRHVIHESQGHAVVGLEDFIKRDTA